MSDAFERAYKKVEALYRELLKIALNHRIKVLVIAAGIFVFSLFITKFIGKEFVPPEDQSRFIRKAEGADRLFC